jgi:hypothetical protein
VEKLSKKMLSYSLAQDSRKGLSFTFNGEKFVSSEDYIDNPDEEKPYVEMEYSRFFEYIRRYMNINIDMFEEHGILVENQSNRIIDSIRYDADIYHYHKDHIIFAIRHNVYQSALDDSITDGRSTSIASTTIHFDQEGIRITDNTFLEHFMFAHNTSELRMNMVVEDIESEPVIIIAIKPYHGDSLCIAEPINKKRCIGNE